MTVRLGLLELLHPDGVVVRAEVRGAACPERLRPCAMDTSPPWDLIVLAPSAPELRSSSWIHESVALVARSLAPDGVVYVIASPLGRARISRALRRAGVPPRLLMLHLPDFTSSAILLPAGRGSLRHAVTIAPHFTPVQRRLLRLALEVPGAVGLLARMRSAVGVVAGHPGGRPAASWLTGGTTAAAPRVAAIQTRWRADRARTVIRVAAPPGGHATVLKVTLGAAAETDGVAREAAALQLLGPAARAAGVIVPEATLVTLQSGHSALRLDEVPGAPVGRALYGRHALAGNLIRRLGAWLERWARATCHMRMLDQALLHDWVLGPAGRLGDHLAPGYLDWLHAACADLRGRSLPVVATHGDLTMSNLLLSRDGDLAVLDWEAASSDGLPLRDFVYAAVDATAALTGYRDRLAAFERCFPGLPPAGPLGEALARLRAVLALPPDYATVAFHACWLQHADDERRKRLPGEARPFLECARRAVQLRWAG